MGAPTRSALFCDMKEKRCIAILANYPIQIHFPDIPHKSSHIAPWLHSVHNAFKSINEYDIHWIVLCKNIKQEIILKECNQSFHLIPRARLSIGLCSAYIWDRRNIKKCIDRLKPDILHAWGMEDCYGLCAKDNKDIAILSIQGLLSVCKQKAKIAKFERIQAYYEPSVLKKVKYITAESEWARDRVLEIASTAQVDILEYAVEQRFFTEERGIDINPNCVMACTNTPIKNVSLAINAFSDKRLSHIKLYIAGIAKEKFSNLPDNIVLLGKVGRDEMVNLLSKAWGLVHTSLADTGPTIVKEARVMRLPVIISENCGAKRYVDNGKSGYIISPYNKEQLINSVLKITKNREISLSMGLHGSDFCRYYLSENTMISNLRRLYNQLPRKN